MANRRNDMIAPVPGAKYRAEIHPKGWKAELAIPWRELSGFDAKPGAVLALELRVNDADKSHPPLEDRSRRRGRPLHRRSFQMVAAETAAGK
ncbi:MAG: hypothetical protein ACI406_04535 [Victivallis vadensis]